MRMSWSKSHRQIDIMIRYIRQNTEIIVAIYTPNHNGTKEANGGSYPSGTPNHNFHTVKITCLFSCLVYILQHTRRLGSDSEWLTFLAA
jgi:hypothetical protein